MPLSQKLFDQKVSQASRGHNSENFVAVQVVGYDALSFFCSRSCLEQRPAEAHGNASFAS